MIEALKNESKESLILENIKLRNENKILSNRISELEYLWNDNKILSTRISELEHQLGLLQKALFGNKKETHQVIDPGQVTLPFEEEVQKVDLDLPQDTEQIAYSRNKNKRPRTDYSKLTLPNDLPQEIIIIEPTDKTDDMVQISVEETRLLAITPARFYIKVITRPRYVKPNKEGFVIAELPSRPIQGGMVDVSLIATILIDKYVDHMPWYRQSKKYERMGVHLSDSTIGNWAHEGIKLLGYLFEALKELILTSRYLQADETPMKVLDKLKKGTCHLGYYWVYHDVESGLVLYDYNPSRGKIAPSTFLKGYTGFLQTDGYGVYDSFGSEWIQLLGCMAHARRKFIEAREDNKVLADFILDKFQQLYEIERQAREENLSHEKRLELRKINSLPVLEEMNQWLKKTLTEVRPTSPIGKAIKYMLPRWGKLIQFTTNGILEIDNNLVENAIRPIALGRKNYLFAGSHEAAIRGGIMYSFATCCKKNGYNFYEWLEETLTKLPDTKKTELHTLLPIKRMDVV